MPVSSGVGLGFCVSTDFVSSILTGLVSVSALAFFSTDSAASLRAAELNADIILKATMVDGIYDKDPKKFPDAQKYDVITHHDILVKRLQVMDSAAAAICTENNIPMIVFDLNRPDNILDAVMGKPVGTLVTKHKA